LSDTQGKEGVAMKTILLCVVLIYSCLAAYSQADSKEFRHITTQSGLSNNWVRSINQDDIGFIWFATADGLNRYDGTEIKVFRLTDSTGQNLGDIHFNALLRKNDKEFWVCTDMGVFTFNFIRQDHFTHPMLEKTSVLCILEDNSKVIWFGTNKGIYRYNPTDSSFKSYSQNFGESGLSSNYINTIFEDSGNNIWVGTKNGLCQYDPKRDSFKSYASSGKDVICLCEDHERRLWIGTSQDGLYLLVKDASGKIGFNQVLKGGVASLFVDNENQLWIGRGSLDGLGIMQTDLYRPGVKPVIAGFTNNPANNKSLSDNSIFCLYQDKTHDMWIGTVEGGVNYTSNREQKFHSIRADNNNSNTIQSNFINVIFEEDRFLWIGTEVGLDRLDKKNGRYRHFQYESDKAHTLGANAVFAICKDSHGNLWIGTWSGGLNLYNYTTETFKRFLTSENENSISSNNVTSILEDSRGNLWIGTQEGGLNRYNDKEGTFRRYVHNESDPHSLYGPSVNKILESRDRRLFVSTYFSVDEFNYDHETFDHYVFNKAVNKTGGKIISLFEDSRKNIWVCTNLGLQLLNIQKRIFIPYLTARELPNYIIYGILEDSHSNLWISTDNGLYEIYKGALTPVKPFFRNFSSDDGLAGNKFIKRAAFKNTSGIMYFGSAKGYTWFCPDSITFNTISPPVVLTDFQLLIAQSDRNKKYKPIPQNINSLERLDLSYRNSNFIIHFAALNYLHPEKNKYRYMLEGFNKDWIDAGNQGIATFTNIQHGRYTFKVIASNNDGIWQENPKSLVIVIHPPWWQTLASKLILMLAVIILLLSTHFIRLSILRRQNTFLEQKVHERTNELLEANRKLKEKQEEVMHQNIELERHRNNLEQLIEERTRELVQAKIKAEESDRLKSSFLANMSHEIRTPMNAIYGFSRLLHNESLGSEDKNRFLDIISTNCEALLVLINDILDISVLEANRPSLLKESLNVKELFSNIEEQFIMRNQKDISFEFINRKDKKELFLINDKVRFTQVVTNLLNNAYKYTDSGKIEFGYKVQKESVLFFVSDTGIGIDKSHVSRIFDEFYKIEDNPKRQYRGTGIGLAISKKIVELMGGTIWVESALHTGSTFYFSLPYIPSDALDGIPEKSDPKSDLFPSELTILIAEDDPVNYELIDVMLKPFGAEIIWVKDGVEAVEHCKNASDHRNCIVLMDVRMPNMDGFEATRLIKQLFPDIPIIAVTAYAQKSDKERIMSSQFDAYVTKPVRIEELISAIANLSAQYRKQ
jgi:signal transduction histidine kinase/ligand-binding sensor domain-containing protein/CheY-like chemotaxis protein